MLEERSPGRSTRRSWLICGDRRPGVVCASRLSGGAGGAQQASAAFTVWAAPGRCAGAPLTDPGRARVCGLAGGLCGAGRCGE
jgi:hypothetical protein